jgi:DNA invertase Pin-like site-specific DNA recombinase
VVAEFFIDKGVSGSTPLTDRPQGSALMAKANTGDTIIVSKLDRIFRSAADALTVVEQFKKKGIDLIVADMGTSAVTQNGSSQMFFGMLACFAEFERSRIIERIKSGRDAKRAAGGFTGGKRPFGYTIEGSGKDSVLVEYPPEQEAIRMIGEWRSQGLSLTDISRELWSKLGIKLSHMGVKSVLNRGQ